MSEAHELHPTILREYDVRGIVDDTLTEADVRAVGRAFGTVAVGHGGKTVAVGYDGRTTSPRLYAALVDGLVACGLTVLRIGRGPTPMLYYATYALETDAGVMITGSHNPPEYNGIKMMLKGRSFYGEDIRNLGSVAAAGDFATGEGKAVDHDLTGAYIDRICGDFHGDRALNIAWDPGNGVTGEVVQEVTRRLPGRHVLINETIDGTFPAHHPDPTEVKNLEQLRSTVAAEKCDLGIAFDGDGDRIGVVDSQGRILWGDQLLAILAREVIADQPGATIIADVKASQALFDEIARLGGTPLMWRTGHSLIKSKMAEVHAPLAGEMSGHIFFGHRYYGFDDAVYAAIRLLSILCSTDETVDAMRDALPQTLSTPELRFDCDEDRKFGIVEEVKQRLASMSGVTVHDIDGVRVQTEDGWWLLRASNTQAVLVARCEGTSEEGLERLKGILVDQLRASGIEPPAFD